MPRYVCVHGHFYQPPRENPWLEEVELQDGAAPYHDWNERITAECYRPNAGSRVLDDGGRIRRIANNYARISFDVGPTLMSWLERHAPDVFAAIRAADRESRERFGGHGSALAQPYHHSILPLATPLDQETQIEWGIRDFRARFGREPEGMWFPEAAVDLDVLGRAAERGIRFTVLSPYQAHRFRERGSSEWTTPPAGGVPTTRAYEVRLPNGRSLAAFFYDGTISSEIAFRGLLHSGTALADRLAGAFDPALGDAPQLVHVATDGETYGHHHRHGDMALAFALERLEGRSDLALTNYGEFLARFPPTFEVELHAPSSWSCAHGVGRWRSDCGCNSGTHPGWNQAWRGPLRASLDGLRDAVRPAMDQLGASLFQDPRATRLDYVDFLGPRSETDRARFLADHAARPLSTEETVVAWSLLELERQLQAMYTSCGWFFDDLGGIESVQVLGYASRAIQLAEERFGSGWEEPFLDRLQKGVSNVPQVGDGRKIFEQLVRPNRISLRSVCAHFALSSLFEEYPAVARIYCYTVMGRDRRVATAGGARLAVGRAGVRSERTGAHAEFTYGALHIGGHNLFGGVRPFRSETAFRETADDLLEAFERGDIPETVRRVDANFAEATYTLRLLFRDEQRTVVTRLYDSLREGVEASFRRIYESTAPILRNLADSGAAAPAALRAAAEFHLNEELGRALERFPPDVEEVGGRLRELDRMRLRVDTAAVALPWQRAAERLWESATGGPPSPALLRTLRELLSLAETHSIEIDLSRLQNSFYERRHARRDGGAAASAPPGAPTDGAEPEFQALAEQLHMVPD